MKKNLVWLLAATWAAMILAYTWLHETREVFLFALAAFAVMGAWLALMARRGALKSYYLGFQKQSENLFLTSMALIALAWCALLIAEPVTDPLLMATVNTVLPLGILLHLAFWVATRGRNHH
jgi:hypothetical protein